MLRAHQAGSRGLGHDRLLGWFGLLARSKDGVQRGAFHARHEFDNARVTHILNEPVDDRIPQLAMGHLPALETQRSFYLVAFTQEANGLVLLGLIIVLIHGHRKLDFFDHNDFLLLARRAVALVLLVEKFTVILNAANRRLSRGRDLHQVQATFAGDLQSFEGRQNSELFTVFVDYADFTRANSVVNADERLGRTLIDGFLRGTRDARPLK